MPLSTLQPVQPRNLLGGVRLLASGAIFLAASAAFPLQAAESISAFIDASGRVVFVNEDSASGRASKSAASSRSISNPGRRIVATSNPAAALSPENATAAPGGTAVADPDDSSSAIMPSGEANDLDSMIEEAAGRHQIDPDLVRAIIRVESNFNPSAISPAGARGLMQLIPATARRFGVANPFDPRANLDGGIRYLKYLLGMYGGNLQLALAGYNAGEDAVARSRGVPDIRETQNYIRKVAELYPLRFVPSAAPPEPQITKYVDESGTVHFSNTDLP
jgi:soluble lytic murein transglycosylase-like protein